MKNTFSKIVLASAVVAAAAFTSIPAMAASEDAANINVPFNFTVHGKTLPAGAYKIRWDENGNYVTLQAALRSRPSSATRMRSQQPTGR